MQAKFKIKKDDKVIVTTGKDKGKVARVLKVDRNGGKVFLENTNVVKRHTRPNPLNPEGGIIEKEMPVDISNVMYYCDSCKKGTRLGIKVLESGKKARFAKCDGEVIDKD
ncbi:50S ribosomal protein L24 [Limisalsivibrio acetivorans]|uniref:50S ribosomal protein L24 n=1 Tax=Limisalsivibrio acetivorans TaxID=1304888 RepID=UPI0003B44F0F|nr:50S ribosomal protein L24 [Limisalsivibrio acetivorans]